MNLRQIGSRLWRLVEQNLVHVLWATVVFWLILEVMMLKTELTVLNNENLSVHSHLRFLKNMQPIISTELPALTCNLRQSVDDLMNFLQSSTTMELVEYKQYLQE